MDGAMPHFFESANVCSASSIAIEEAEHTFADSKKWGMAPSIGFHPSTFDSGETQSRWW